MIEVNTDEYYKEYPNILRSLAENNDILPVLLKQYNSPNMKENVEGNVEVDTTELMKKYVQRRIDERKIYHKYDSISRCRKEINEYHEKELKKFIRKYPQYKNILK